MVAIIFTGCFCDEGTILLEEDGEVCVAPTDCPVNETEQACPEGKVYQQCGTACPLTCENKDDDIICTKQCVQGRLWYMTPPLLLGHCSCFDVN